ncbi:MAG: hypothetical protein KBC17_02180 [Candidatus Pacebacteria bacterium]|nr:hypothetical protein [Candidatus Paceibacterota bacterium]
MKSFELKIERAKEHLQELQKEMGTFFVAAPYKVETKLNADRKIVYFVSEVKETPEKMAVITGEVIACLRSALDNVAYQLVLNGTGASFSTEKIYFPISDDLAKYDINKVKMLKGATPAAITAIDTMQPYKGANDLLWKLNKLNNIDKHRLLITVGSSFRSADLGAYMLPMMREMRKNLQQAHPEQYPEPIPDIKLSAFFAPADREFPLKVGTELLIGAIDEKPNPDMAFKFEVGFNEPEADITNGEPLMETLQNMMQAVEKVVIDLKPYL